MNNRIPSTVAIASSSLLALNAFRSPSLFSFLPLLLFVVLYRFYQDPERICPADPRTIYAPCDGVIKKITGAEALIYMDLRDCHIQRMPMAGTIRSKLHKPGDFLYAWEDKMAGYNEQHSTIIDTAHGQIDVVQIAGKLARRIECWVEEGREYEAGDRLGMIHFSSACLIRLPLTANITVNLGDRIYAGITPIASILAEPTDVEQWL